jgi:hypothetical protein
MERPHCETNVFLSLYSLTPAAAVYYFKRFFSFFFIAARVHTYQVIAGEDLQERDEIVAIAQVLE